jgi:DNA repair protein RadC
MDRLTQVVGVGERTAEFINKVGRLSDIIGAEIIDGGGVNFADYESVGRYITSYFSGVTDKQVVALYLDSSMRLISMKKMYDLEYESGGVKPKPFIDEALTSHAAVVITAHNHPYGPDYATEGDHNVTQWLKGECAKAGLVLFEHYIVCGRSIRPVLYNLSDDGLLAADAPYRDLLARILGGASDD